MSLRNWIKIIFGVIDIVESKKTRGNIEPEMRKMAENLDDLAKQVLRKCNNGLIYNYDAVILANQAETELKQFRQLAHEYNEQHGASHDLVDYINQVITNCNAMLKKIRIMERQLEDELNSLE